MFHSMKEKLKLALDGPRYEHTLGVMYTAGSLAMAYGYNIEKAMIGGLLHDCAKCLTHEERVELCKKYQVEVSASEFENKAILHAKAGAILAKIEYDITDIEILHAIAAHTTGKPNMSMLDKIIYIADYIEPGRDKAPNLEYIRCLAYKDLDACMAEILEDTLNYLNSRRGNIDPATADAYAFYKEYRKENEHGII